MSWHFTLKLGPPEGEKFQVGTCADVTVTIANGNYNSGTRSLLCRPCGARGRILRQRNVIAKGGLQAFDGAILIAAACAPADADGTDHLAVDNDREAA
jgi:hypothetical protein